MQSQTEKANPSTVQPSAREFTEEEDCVEEKTTRSLPSNQDEMNKPIVEYSDDSEDECVEENSTKSVSSSSQNEENHCPNADFRSKIRKQEKSSHPSTTVCKSFYPARQNIADSVRAMEEATAKHQVKLKIRYSVKAKKYGRLSTTSVCISARQSIDVYSKVVANWYPRNVPG